MPTATTTEAETDNPHPSPGFLSRHRRTLTATALAAAALLGYTLTRDDDAPPEQRPVPTAPVTYTVDGEGTAQITYVARSTTGAGTTIQEAALPWRKTVRVPLGRTPTITLVLPDDGGQATCTLAIRGNLAQRSTATGPHGRATCSADLPRQDRRPALG